MATIYFENEKTGKRYKLISMDKDAGEVTLQGEHTQFVEKYSKERFQRLGYKLVRVEEADDE